MQPIRTIQLREGRMNEWARGVENAAVCLTYDMGDVLAVWPDAQPSVAFERADGAKYAHEWERDGDVLYIPLTLADTETAGVCKCVISMMRGDERANTVVFYGNVTQGIDSIGDAPTQPEMGIIEQCNDAAVRAEHAAQQVINASADKLDSNQGVENAGQLLYISADGAVIPLRLGSGLEIVDGVLRVTGIVTPPDEPDEPVEPDEPDKPDERFFTDVGNGAVLINGVAFAVQDDGSVMLDGARFTVQDDGSVLID